jgi:hypothetical protein
MTSSTTQYLQLQATKPHGGFVFLTVLQLCLLWWLYRTRRIQLRDYRIWHACHEMVARRCQLAPNQDPEYTLTELHKLVGGVGGAHLRASLRRLEALGLLTWSRTRITFATSVEDLHGVEQLTDFHTMLAVVAQAPQRRVPVSRQTLRLIAGGCAIAMIATMLGHLLRCLYYHTRPHRCVSGGWCKLSWIAEVFRINLRNVKSARRHLAALGWLQILPVPQYTLNRWGSYVQVSLTWERTARDAQASITIVQTPALTALLAPVSTPTGSPPPAGFSTIQEPPPSIHYEPLRDFKHQKPAPAADPIPPPPHPQHHPEPAGGEPISGVYKQGKKKPLTQHSASLSPTLRHIVPEDLQDTSRLLALFEQAQREGLIGKSDSERLTFVSLAEHARVVGAQNPCGLFAELLRRGRWHFITESDEAVAHQRLKAHLYGRSSQRQWLPQPQALQPELSKDAAIVRYLQTHLARAGLQGDVFALVHREDPSWTRERWDDAVLELAQAKRTWQQANDLNRLGSMRALEACPTSVVSGMDNNYDGT